MKKLKKEDLIGKFVVGFDTMCQGHRCAIDENEQPDPNLYDSYDEAFKELFIDAYYSIEGNEEHLEDEDARDKMMSEMKVLIKEGDIEKMKAYFEKEPDANYNEEFIQEADQFIWGRQAMFTGNGVRIDGTKLEDFEYE